MPHEILIDGERFSDYDGFVAAFSRAYVALLGEPEWDGESFLDFDDLVEAARDATGERLTIRWVNSQKSRTDLGHEAMADYWRQAQAKIPASLYSPAGYRLVYQWDQERIDEADGGRGRTLFEWLVWQIGDGESVDLILE